MTDARTAIGSDEVGSQCSCCGQVYPEDRMVRLSRHNEVAICFHCLDYLNRERARKRRELFRAALPGWVPDLPRLRGKGHP
ncbi:MAG: hypothetical protein ACRD0V_08065 [Acidimicrobiales bacterium]